jgi:hypothetical protein
MHRAIKKPGGCLGCISDSRHRKEPWPRKALACPFAAAVHDTSEVPQERLFDSKPLAA